jgi:hypothetical protein
LNNRYSQASSHAELHSAAVSPSMLLSRIKESAETPNVKQAKKVPPE